MFKLCVFYILIISFGSTAQESSKYKPLKTFAQSLNLIEENHPQSVQRSRIIDGAIQGMLFELDPYSSLMTLKETESFNQYNLSSHTGIGIAVAFNKNKQILVLSVMEGSEAFKKGILPGDQITHIQKKSTQNQSFEFIRNQITNKKSSFVQLTIRRENSPEPLQFNLPVSRIHIPSVSAQKINNNFFYTQISSFRSSTFQDFKKLLRVKSCFLQKESLLCSRVRKGLILDLRQNPGGIVEQSLLIADLFISKGVLTRIRGKKEEYNQTFNAKKIGTLKFFPIVVLINEYSASASEVLASALKDNHRALVFGKTSFGKGAIQRLFPLNKEYTLKLTTAYYYTPQGSSIEQKGLSPHIDEKSNLHQQKLIQFKNQFYRRFKVKKEHLDKSIFKKDSEWIKKEQDDPLLKQGTSLLFHLVQQE